mmetsp:Transcript_7890/g.12065  ORF Transcript_7890/g.12065 Transcript_7890/m.12065 type:complete len:87 (-) Transcript_7890:118-378(-)
MNTYRQFFGVLVAEHPNHTSHLISDQREGPFSLIDCFTKKESIYIKMGLADMAEKQAEDAVFEKEGWVGWMKYKGLRLYQKCSCCS